MPDGHMDRRTFLKHTAAGVGAALAGLPATVRGAPALREGQRFPADHRLRVAVIGCGGKGSYNLRMVERAGAELVGLCDVDLRRGREHFRRLPTVPRYRDYRDMLHELDDRIDAVIVSTPDHTHFPAALMAIEMGKHAYVEKPATHTVVEARRLAEAARRHKVVTQMGNQGHANEGTRLMREWIQAGVIGPVHEVHVWTNRPIWEQPCPSHERARIAPPELDWNLWLGVAAHRPYNEGYAPFSWRGWWDFGCGALGDMGCHILDASFWALDLAAPESVEAECGPFTEESPPAWSIVTYRFPARGEMPPVKVIWYDGGKKPPRPPGLEADRKLPAQGQYFLGEKGVLMEAGAYGVSPRLVPEERMKAFLPNRPPKTIPRVPEGDPHLEWVNGCRGGPMPGSNLAYSGPLTEMVLLGNAAIRAGSRIDWDAKALTITNLPEANRFLAKTYRRF